jgi:adenylate cyclase
VVGDIANTVARLSASAAAGEVVLSQAVLDDVGVDSSGLEHRLLDLKGKAEPFEAWVWQVGDPDPIGV